MTNPNARKVPLDEATDAELASFAMLSLGLEIGPKDKREQILAKIRTTYTADFLVVPKATDLRERPRDLTASVRPAENGVEEDDEIHVLIHADQKDSSPVWLAVNGIGLWVPRGVKVWLKRRYVNVLEQAEQFVYPEYDVNLNGGLGGLSDPRVVKLYPFSYA